jgi:hypothetical protein
MNPKVSKGLFCFVMEIICVRIPRELAKGP